MGSRFHTLSHKGYAKAKIYPTREITMAVEALVASMRALKTVAPETAATGKIRLASCDGRGHEDLHDSESAYIIPIRLSFDT
jgi:hypothetical protein